VLVKCCMESCVAADLGSGLIFTRISDRLDFNFNNISTLDIEFPAARPCSLMKSTLDDSQAFIIQGSRPSLRGDGLIEALLRSYESRPRRVKQCLDDLKPAQTVQGEKSDVTRLSHVIIVRKGKSLNPQ